MNGNVDPGQELKFNVARPLSEETITEDEDEITESEDKVKTREKSNSVDSQRSKTVKSDKVLLKTDSNRSIGSDRVRIASLTRLPLVVPKAEDEPKGNEEPCKPTSLHDKIDLIAVYNNGCDSHYHVPSVKRTHSVKVSSSSHRRPSSGQQQQQAGGRHPQGRRLVRANTVVGQAALHADTDTSELLKGAPIRLTLRRPTRQYSQGSLLKRNPSQESNNSCPVHKDEDNSNPLNNENSQRRKSLGSIRKKDLESKTIRDQLDIPNDYFSSVLTLQQILEQHSPIIAHVDFIDSVESAFTSPLPISSSFLSLHPSPSLSSFHEQLGSSPLASPTRRSPKNVSFESPSPYASDVDEEYNLITGVYSPRRSPNSSTPVRVSHQVLVYLRV